MMKVIEDRQHDHGEWETNASISAQIGSLIDTYGFELNASQEQALRMIGMKIARILSGNADYKDHWLDIAGYAYLGGQLGKDFPLVDLTIKDIPE